MSIWTNCYTCHKAIIVGTPCPNCEAPRLSPSDPLRERVEAAVYGIPLERDKQLIARLVALVQSERQQAAEQMREACGQVCDAAEKAKWELREVLSAAEIGRRVRALKLTGGESK